MKEQKTNIRKGPRKRYQNLIDKTSTQHKL